MYTVYAQPQGEYGGSIISMQMITTHTLLTLNEIIEVNMMWNLKKLNAVLQSEDSCTSRLEPFECILLIMVISVY